MCCHIGFMKDGERERRAWSPCLVLVALGAMEDEEAFCYSGKNTSLYRQDAGFLDGMSVEDYGQARARRLGESSAQ